MLAETQGYPNENIHSKNLKVTRGCRNKPNRRLDCLLTWGWSVPPGPGGFPGDGQCSGPAGPFLPCRQIPPTCTQPKDRESAIKRRTDQSAGKTLTKKLLFCPLKGLVSRQAFESMLDDSTEQSFSRSDINSNSSVMFPWLWLCSCVIPCLKEGLIYNNSIPQVPNENTLLKL